MPKMAVYKVAFWTNLRERLSGQPLQITLSVTTVRQYERNSNLQTNRDLETLKKC